MKTIYALAAAALLSLTACSSDDIAEQGGVPDNTGDEKLCEVRFRISAANQTTASTRASWVDPNATDDEMMNVWTIVAVHNDGDENDGKIAFIHACRPGNDNREIDDLAKMAPGKYAFYSFANMEPGYVTMNILGIGHTENSLTPIKSDGSLDTENKKNFPGGFFDYGYGSNQGSGNNPTTSDGNLDPNAVYALEFDPATTLKLHKPSTDQSGASGDTGVAGKTVGVTGNGFNPSSTTDNGFRSWGIPMSNYQEITITESTSVDIIVVRMMAKIELRLYNETANDIKVNSVSLTEITQNGDNSSGNVNLKLLPNLSSGANFMTYKHQDIRPNLGENARTDLFKYDMSSNPVTVPANTKTSGSDYKTVTFYVNETAKPTGNPYGLFYLGLEIDKGSSVTETRYALISNTTLGEWDYIARNDYRVIPVAFDDYKLDIIPYDFPAIGVYPASVKEEDGVFTINFHDYGHFHLLPKVTKMSDGTEVPFTATTPTGTFSGSSWGLIDNDFASSWRSFSDGSMTTAYDNATASPAFYRTGTDSYVTTTVDGDEVGGAPVWYANTSAPQWDPAGGSIYKPFIFGYIADPGAAITSDRMVFHKFTINLYRDGTTAARQMVYNLCIILDTDQMSYSRGDVTPGGSRGLGVERPRLPHSHIWK